MKLNIFKTGKNFCFFRNYPLAEYVTSRDYWNRCLCVRFNADYSKTNSGGKPEGKNDRKSTNQDKTKKSVNKSEESEGDSVDTVQIKRSVLRAVGKKPLSPSERLEAVLSDNQGSKGADLSQDNNVSSRASSAPTDRKHGKLKQSLAARARVKPSQRLADLIPPDYWENIQDSDTKTIVEVLAEKSNTPKTK